MSTSDSKNILKAAGTVSGFTILSRMLGLTRDILSAIVFGSGMVWDSFVLAFTIPNLFRRIFGEGALTSAFLPVAVRVRKEEGEEPAARLTSAVVTVVGVMLAITAVVIAGGALVKAAGGGFSAEQDLTALLIAILIFYLPFICASAVLAAALNSVRHFAVPAFAPVLLNIVWIAAMGILAALNADLTHKALLLAFGLVGAGILQFGIQIPVLRKRGLPLRPRWNISDPDVKQVYSSMVPVVVSLVVMQINVLVDRLLATWMIEGDGAISALFYGNRLMQFPLAIFGIAMGVAVFPHLREYAVDRNYDKIWKTLNMGMRILVLLVVPCSIGLIVAGRPVIELFFNWGRFAASADAAGRTYGVLAAYSMGLLFFSLNIIITKTFHSLDNRVFPARIAGLMVFLNLGLNLLFLSITNLRETGLALSTSITALINVIILTAFLVRRYGFNEARGLLPVFSRTAAASVIMGILVVVLMGFGSFQLIGWGSGLSGKMLRVVCGIGAGVFVYFGSHMLIRTNEMKFLTDIIRKRKA